MLKKLNAEIRAYLRSHPALNRIAFEKEAGMTRNTLKDFISGKRQFQNDESTFRVVWALVRYGFMAEYGARAEGDPDIFGYELLVRTASGKDTCLDCLEDLLNFL